MNKLDNSRIFLASNWCCTGVLLDATDTDFTYTAFHYQVEKHNNVTSSAFKLDRYEKQLGDIGDNFQLIRAGQYVDNQSSL